MRTNQAQLRSTVTLALPIIVQNLISYSLAMADTFMVGALGEQEMAALTAANAIFFVVSLF